MKLGEAVVTMSGNQSCFSVPNNAATADGIPVLRLVDGGRRVADAVRKLTK